MDQNCECMTKRATPTKTPIIKELSTNAGYLVGILGFAGIVWAMAVKTTDKSYNVANLKKDLNDVRVTVNRVEDKIDSVSAFYPSIDAKQNDMIYLIGDIREDQEALKVAFSKHLRVDNRYEELIQFLENYKSNVTKATEDSIKYNIRVKKIP